MKIICCNSCAALLNAEIMPFKHEDHIYGEDGCVRDDLAAWDGDTFRPVAACPCCGARLFNDGQVAP